VRPPQVRRGNGETIPPCCVNWMELEEAPRVDIVGAFDVHRKQITFDYVQTDSGEVHRGKIRPADDNPPGRPSFATPVPPVQTTRKT
jgi:hypothetical protein